MIEYELKEPLNVRIFIPEINYLLQRFLYICRHPAFIESQVESSTVTSFFQYMVEERRRFG